MWLYHITTMIKPRIRRLYKDLLLVYPSVSLFYRRTLTGVVYHTSPSHSDLRRHICALKTTVHDSFFLNVLFTDEHILVPCYPKKKMKKW